MLLSARLTGCCKHIAVQLRYRDGAFTPLCQLTERRHRCTMAQRPRVFVTRRLHEAAQDLLRSKCEVNMWDSDEVVPREELLKGVKDVDALLCLLTDKIDAELLDAAGPNLKVVSTMSVGYDHVDIGECKRRSIPVGYTPDVLTDATAELTVALLLSTARRIPEGIHAARSGEWGTWKPYWLCGQSLHGSTVGIVGLGRIGRAIASRLKPFGVQRMVYTGRNKSPHEQELAAEYVPLDDLLKMSDFVIASCALTPDTKNMFNKSAFAKMKKTAILINTSRGPVVNQEDLYEALRVGEIGAAGLDVTTPEPLPTDNPLLQLPNCVVLPHIGSASYSTRCLMADLAVRNLLAALEGSPMPAQLNVQ